MSGTPSNSMNLNSTTSGLVNWNGVSVMSSTALVQYETLVAASSNTIQPIAVGTSGWVLTSAGPGAYPAYAAPATSGTVTSVSVVSANGFAGTVATATTTPAITLSTTITGVLSGNGTAITGSAITQFDVLVGGATNAITSISPSTAGLVLTSNGVSANPTFQALSFTKMPWTDEAISFNAAVGNGYYITATATATLPASPSQGDIIAFCVDSVAGILTIQANTGQIIQIGKTISASAGIAVSNFNGDSVTLVYRTSDTKWLSAFGGVEGTFTIT